MSGSRNGWDRRRLTLPVRAGPMSLYEWAIDAAVMTRHFSELGAEVGEMFPAEVMADKGTSCAVIHSCPVVRRLPRVSWQGGGIRYVPCHYPRYYTETSGDFEEYISKQFSGKSRSTLRRKVRKLGKELGDAESSALLREYSRPEELPEWHRLARDVSALTYQERLLKRGLPDSPEYLEEIEEMAARGLFRGYLLFDRSDDTEKPIAYLACPISEGGAIIYDHVGHDPDYDRLSPGTVLLYLVIERSFQDPSIGIFDFTEGEGDHKQRFATHEEQCADVFFFRPGPLNLLGVGAHLAVDSTTQGAVRLLDRFQLKERVKRLVRGRTG